MPRQPTDSALPASSALTAAVRRFGPCLALVGLTVLAYLPAMNGSLLWDDSAHITQPELQSLDGLRRIWFELGATQQYYPLLHTAFWIEHRLWGDAVVGYHLVNILLHAASASLVVALMRHLRLPGAWLAGLIFALHPVHVETVAWISEQKNTLSTVLCLGSALLYLRFDRTRRPVHYWLALALFLAGLLSKTVIATLPAVLAVIFWWQRGRLAWRRDVRPLAPWLALGLGAGLFSAWVERTFVGAEGIDFALPVLARCLLAGRIIWFYFGKLVWPSGLVFSYPRWEIDPAVPWQYLFPLGVIVVALGLAFLARRQRGPLAAFLIFVGVLFPALGFINVFPFVYSYVADHFQYLASLGVIVPLSAALTSASRRFSAAAPRVARLGGVVLIAVLGALTWKHSASFRDSETLYRATLARNPDSAIAHNNLGEILLERPGRLPDAIAHFEAALRSNPRNPEAHNNLGYALSRVPDRLADAIAEYEIAVRLAPNSAKMHNNLGVALSKTPGRLAEAITHFGAAIRLNPRAAEVHDNLGSALLRVPGRLADATEQFEIAVQLAPKSAALQTHLGIAWAQTPGRLSDAIQCFRTALRLDPRRVDAHISLGKALALNPDTLPEAISHFTAAVDLDPESAEAHAQLGIALMRVNDHDPDAIPHLEAAVRINPDYFEPHYLLGLALFPMPGRRHESLAHFEAALRIRPDFAPAREWIERLRSAGVR